MWPFSKRGKDDTVVPEVIHTAPTPTFEVTNVWVNPENPDHMRVFGNYKHMYGNGMGYYVRGDLEPFGVFVEDPWDAWRYIETGHEVPESFGLTDWLDAWKKKRREQEAYDEATKEGK